MQIHALTKPPSVASHSLHPKPQHALQGFSQPGASLPFPASSHPGPLSGDIPLIHNQEPVPLQPPRLKMPVLCHKDQFKCHFLCNSFPIHLVRINCFLLWDPSAVCIGSFLRLSLLPGSEGSLAGSSRCSHPQTQVITLSSYLCIARVQHSTLAHHHPLQGYLVHTYYVLGIGYVIKI